MNDIIKTVITLLVGGVLGGLIQAIFAYKKEVLSIIWTKRFEAYHTVWAITSVLPKYPEDTSVTYKELFATCLKLKNWYFKNGGIILSGRSRVVYEELQKTLYAISVQQTEEQLTAGDYHYLREIFSRFRSALTRDLTSRNKSLI